MSYPSNSGGIARDLKSIVAEARPLIEQQLEIAKKIAGLREAATAKGLDWSQIKALLKAQIEDENDESGEGKRVKRLVEKAEHATDYAALLGLNMNEKNSFAAEEADDQSTAALMEVRANSTESEPAPAALDPAAATTPQAGTQAPPVEPIAAPAQTGSSPSLAGAEGDADRPPLSDAAKNALRLRPHCQAALRDEITKCAGYGKVTCFDCSKAHADAEGQTA